MNATPFKDKTNLERVIGYYDAMIAKDFETMGSYLHDEVEFLGPLAERKGKASLIAAAENLSQILDKIEIRSRFENDNQVMLAYDFLFPSLNLNLRSAGMINFKKGLIIRIEVFYDGRPFQQKQEEIFTDQS